MASERVVDPPGEDIGRGYFEPRHVEAVDLSWRGTSKPRSGSEEVQEAIRWR
jgi:hypothetical protein